MAAVVTLGLLVVLGGVSLLALRGRKKMAAAAATFQTRDGQEVAPNKKGIWPAISGNIVAGGEDEHSARYV